MVASFRVQGLRLPEIRQRLPRLPCKSQRQRQVRQHRDIVAVRGNCLLKPGNRLLLMPHPLQRHGQIAGRSGRAGICVQRPPERRHRLVVLSRRSQRAAVFGQRFRIRRSRIRRRLQHRQRPGRIPFPQQQHPQMHSRRRVPSVFSHRPLKLSPRRIPALQARVRGANGVVHRGSRSGELLLFGKFLQRIFRPAGGHQRTAVIVVEGRVLALRAQLQRCFKMRNRLRSAAHLAQRNRQVCFNARHRSASALPPAPTPEPPQPAVPSTSAPNPAPHVLRESPAPAAPPVANCARASSSFPACMAA